MKTTCKFPIAGVLSCCLLASCTKPPAETPAIPPHPAAINTRHAALGRTLAGSWHNNNHDEGGATKRFIPHTEGDILQGRACGFWATCGTYKITRSDAVKRSLSVIISIPENEDQGVETFLADISFDPAGNHMTFTRSGRTPVVFYRVR